MLDRQDDSCVEIFIVAIYNSTEGESPCKARASGRFILQEGSKDRESSLQRALGVGSSGVYRIVVSYAPMPYTWEEVSINIYPGRRASYWYAIDLGAF